MTHPSSPQNVLHIVMQHSSSSESPSPILYFSFSWDKLVMPPRGGNHRVWKEVIKLLFDFLFPHPHDRYTHDNIWLLAIVYKALRYFDIKSTNNFSLLLRKKKLFSQNHHNNFHLEHDSRIFFQRIIVKSRPCLD